MTHEKQHSLTDPASPAFGIGSTAALGALALIDSAGLDHQQRRAVHILTAVLGGIYTGVVLGGRHAPVKALTGCLAAAVTLRFADAGDVIDARLEGKLRRVGVRHPRRWMAVGTAAVTFAGFLQDRATARKQQSAAFQADPTGQLGPLDARVRGLIEGMLSAGDTLGAPVLRAQLEVAQALHWTEDFTSAAFFRVPDDLPRAVPHDQVFPVRARFLGPEGVLHEIFLQISGGHLDQLAMDIADQADVDSFDDFPHEWPDPSEVVHVVESADGTRTVP